MVSMLLTEDDETNTITKTVTVNAPPTVTFDWDPDARSSDRRSTFSLK